MIAMTERPSVAIYRWQGFGVDVHCVIMPTGPLFRCADVCLALAVVPALEADPQQWGEVRCIYPGRTREVLDDGSGIPTEYYTPDQVVWLAEREPEWFTPKFLEWFEGILDPSAGMFDNDVYDDPEPGRKALAAGQTFSVARAAERLSRDPAIDLGMKHLFELMRNIGWITKEHDIWVPTSEVLRSGYLVRHKVRLEGFGQKRTKPLYPQIRVTYAGLEALHHRLGGQAAVAIDPPADLTLVELS